MNIQSIQEVNVATKNTEKPAARRVQSIELGAKLLSALAEENEPLMLKEIAQVAGFAPAQAHAYLVSYRKIGLVEQDPDTGRYRLGRFALDLGIIRMHNLDPVRLATEAARELSEKIGLSVALVAWGGFGPTVILVEESGSQLNMTTRPGTVYSITGTAAGRVFSAHLPDKIIKEAINKEKREGNDSRRIGEYRFMSAKEVKQVREEGYSSVDPAPVPGISAYSAPIFDHSGKMILAMTIIGQDHYIKNKAAEEFIPALLHTTHELSQELGYRESH